MRVFMAGEEVKQWRKKAFAALEDLIKIRTEKKRIEIGLHYRKSYARGWAYKWLSDQLGIPRKHLRISTFTIGTCQKIIDLCSQEVL